jgi:hypothetical protein
VKDHPYGKGHVWDIKMSSDAHDWVRVYLTHVPTNQVRKYDIHAGYVISAPMFTEFPVQRWATTQEQAFRKALKLVRMAVYDMNRGERV